MYILLENFLLNPDVPILFSSERKTLGGLCLRDPDPTKPWQTTGDSSEYVRIDCDSFSARPNAFAIRSHNLTTSATVKVQDDDDAAFGSVGLDETLTIPNYPYNYGTAYLAQTYMTTFTTATQRYVRALFADASNPDGFLRFGIIAVGKVATLRGIDFGWADSYEDTAPTFKALDGIFYARPRRKPRVMNVRVSLADLDNKQVMRRLGRIGGARPTFVSFSPFNNSEKATQTLYGVFRRLPNLTERVHHGRTYQPAVEYARNDVDFEFEEIC